MTVQYSYSNLDIVIRRDAEQKGLTLQVLGHPSGPVPYALPFDAPSLKGVSERLMKEAEAISIGQVLFESIFYDGLLSYYHEKLDDARARELGLCLRLHLDDVPDLLTLPWEYLYEPKNQFLNRTTEIQILRRPLEARPRPPRKIVPPLRILVVIANPMDYEEFDAALEWDQLNKELADLIAGNAVYLELLGVPTFVGLREKLRDPQQEGEFHILHFIGHGVSADEKKRGVLIFERPDRSGDPVTGEQLAVLLGGYRPMRLAFLNACDTAAVSTNPTASVAHILAKQGLDCVIGMGSKILDDTATRIARSFYGSLSGNRIEYAVADARIMAYAERPQSMEWAIPIVYSSLDNVLFEFDRDWESRAREFSEAPLASQGEDLEKMILMGLALIKEGQVLGGKRNLNTDPIRTIVTDLVGRLATNGHAEAFESHLASLLKRTSRDEWIRKELMLMYLRHVLANNITVLREARNFFDAYGEDDLFNICTHYIREAIWTQQTDVPSIIERLKVLRDQTPLPG